MSSFRPKNQRNFLRTSALVQRKMLAMVKKMTPKRHFEINGPLINNAKFSTLEIKYSSFLVFLMNRCWQNILECAVSYDLSKR